MLEQVRELTKQLAQKEVGKEPGTIVIRNPNEPNPPPGLVNGKIAKVDGSLVEINLGQENGLKENHTLEVYRLQPQPKYLGMVRIVSVANGTSIGRFIGKAPMLKEGDSVTSKLK